MDARPAPTPATADAHARAGLLFGIGAYGMWGLLPIYFKLIAAVPAVAIVAHRVVWSMVALAALLAAAAVRIGE